MVSLMLIIGDELPADLVEKTQPIIGRAHINASGARPGGDRIKIAGIQAKNMLFLNQDVQFEEVIRVIEGEIKFVPWIGMQYGYTYRLTRGGLGTPEASGRGMQYDYSFHHRTDGVNNTLSYGLGYASAFVEWARDGPSSFNGRSVHHSPLYPSPPSDTCSCRVTISTARPKDSLQIYY